MTRKSLGYIGALEVSYSIRRYHNGCIHRITETYKFFDERPLQMQEVEGFFLALSSHYRASFDLVEFDYVHSRNRATRNRRQGMGRLTGKGSNDPRRHGRHRGTAIRGIKSTLIFHDHACEQTTVDHLSNKRLGYHRTLFVYMHAARNRGILFFLFCAENYRLLIHQPTS